jgi:hypothetical protein
MKVQIDRDKKLPQFYVTGFVTDAELAAFEADIPPRQFFKGLSSYDVMRVALVGLVYATLLKEQEDVVKANQNRIEVVS